MTILGRMCVAAVLGAFAGAAALVFFYGVKPAIVLDMDRRLPGVLAGFHAPERDKDDLSFAWTTGRAELRLPGIDRRSAWTVTIRFRGARPDPTTLPEVRVAVDGTLVATKAASNRFEALRVVVPPSPANDRGAVLTLMVSPTFVPGPADPRELGIVVDEVRVAPAADAVALPPRRALGSGMMTAGLFGAAFAVSGLTLIAAVASATVVALGQAAGMASGLGPYLPYGGDIAWYGFAIALLLAVTVPAIEAGTRRRFRNTARFAAAFSAAALYLKLVVLLHPDVPAGAALAEAGRFDLMRGGLLSEAAAIDSGTWPPPAVALYLVAAPFSLFASDPGHLVDLLRVVAAVAHAAAGLLVYLMIVRMSGDRLAGAVATGIYHLVPIGFLAQGQGLVGQVFGQSLLLAAMATVALGLVRPRSWRGLVLGGVAAVLAALSHPTAFVVTTIGLATTAVLFARRGGPVLRSSARAVGLLALPAGLAGAALARRAGWRGWIETLGADPGVERTVGGDGAVEMLTAMVDDLVAGYGVALIALAVLGAWWLWRRHQRDRLSLVLVAWGVASVVVIGIGAMAGAGGGPWLELFPALAVLAGLGAASLWRRGRRQQGLALALLATIMAQGVWEWLRPLAGWTLP